MTERLLNDFSTRFADVEENLKRIREAIAEAARKSGARKNRRAVHRPFADK